MTTASARRSRLRLIGTLEPSPRARRTPVLVWIGIVLAVAYAAALMIEVATPASEPSAAQGSPPA